MRQSSGTPTGLSVRIEGKPGQTLGPRHGLAVSGAHFLRPSQRPAFRPGGSRRRVNAEVHPVSGRMSGTWLRARQHVLMEGLLKAPFTARTPVQRRRRPAQPVSDRSLCVSAEASMNADSPSHGDQAEPDVVVPESYRNICRLKYPNVSQKLYRRQEQLRESWCPRGVCCRIYVTRRVHCAGIRVLR